jgi:hypothetical protein
VAVQVEGVLARVEVVEHNIDDLIFLENERVCVGAIDGRVGGVLVGSEDGVEGWDFGCDVGNVVEKCAALALIQVHDKAENVW